MKLTKLAMSIGLLTATLFAQNLLKNPSFEEVSETGAPVGWTDVRPVYTVTEEMPRLGKKSLYFKNDDEKKYVICSQDITALIDRNTYYRFGVYVMVRNLNGNGPTICVEFWNGEKYLDGVYPEGTTSTNGAWSLSENFIKSVPEKTTRITLAVYCREGTTGEAWFDDAFLEPYSPPLLSTHTTDAYHNMIDGHRDLKIYASVFTKDSAFQPIEVPDLKLHLFDATKKELATIKPEPFDDNGVCFSVATSAMPSGEYTYRIEANNNGTLEAVEGSFTRVETYPQRKSYFDDHRRLIVDGKPFFPLGMYFSGFGDDYELFRGSPFNCIMPYQPIPREALDILHKDGISVIYSVKDIYPGHIGIKTQEEADAKTIQTINSLKDHPAIIAWYVNDELPLTMLQQLKNKRDLVEKIDPSRPSWSVQYQYKDIREYLPCFDVIGTDPYPISDEANPRMALDYARSTTKGGFGVRPNWMVPQVFNWASYWNGYNRSLSDILKCRAPSFEEMKAMTWMCIAGGATGLVYYSWFDLVSMGTERKYKGDESIVLPADDFEKRWSEVKTMAEEVKQHMDILLAVDSALDIKAIDLPDAIGMRTFGKSDETWLLLVNSDNANSLSCTLETPIPIACNGTTLSNVQPQIDGTTIKIALKPLEAVFLKLVRK